MSDAPTLTGRRVLVTGGAGFIGCHVVRDLIAGGASVTVADLRPTDQAESIVGDLTDPGMVTRAMAGGVDSVVHLAARTSVLGSVRDPAGTYEANVKMTAALLESSRTVGARCFVLASTNAVVGTGVSGVLDEAVPLAPLTPYGATKAAGEMLLSAYDASYGIRGTALRLTNVYGPAMTEKDSVVPRLMRAAVSGAAFEVYGDGTQVRDYVNVADVVAAVRLTLTAESSGPLVIGSGTSVSVLDLVEAVRSVTGRPVAATHGPARGGEMTAVRVSNARARSWGWDPSVNLPDGLAAVWESWPRPT